MRVHHSFKNFGICFISRNDIPSNTKIDSLASGLVSAPSQVPEPTPQIRSAGGERPSRGVISSSGSQPPGAAPMSIGSSPPRPNVIHFGFSNRLVHSVVSTNHNLYSFNNLTYTYFLLFKN